MQFCFSFSVCGVLLSLAQTEVWEGVVLCSSDYLVAKGTRCAGCDSEFIRGSVIVGSGTRVFHLECYDALVLFHS